MSDQAQMGQDPDAVRAELDQQESDSDRVAGIVAPDQGAGPDLEKDMIGRAGQGTTWDGPEESAMHYVDDGA